jgi:nucleotide-binding universal stress UspA family protein
VDVRAAVHGGAVALNARVRGGRSAHGRSGDGELQAALRDRSGAHLLALGGLSHAVATHAPCDALVVRAQDGAKREAP